MAIQPDRAPEPDTAILGDTTNDHISEPQWKIVPQIYHAALNAVAIVALVVILVVKAGIVNVGDKNAQDEWSEVASQVLTGVFTWISITNVPVYTFGVVMTSRVLKPSNELYNARMWSSICAARYLSEKFPLIFIDTRTTRVNDANHFEDGYSNPTAQAEKKMVGYFGNIVFLRNDAKHLRTTFLLLSCGCFFQFVMAGYMWGYDANSRPGFMLPALLPPIIICNAGGQYRLSQLNKRNKKRITADEEPIQGQISSTRTLSPV